MRDEGIALLHRYGIDVRFRADPHVYEGPEAPEEARGRMREVWAG